VTLLHTGVPMAPLEFFIDIKSFRSHYGPGVDSASNGNEYQEYFLGVKAAGKYGRPYGLHVPTDLESESPNLLEHLGPVQGLLYNFTTHKICNLRVGRFP